MLIRIAYLIAPRNYLDPGTGSMLLQAIIAGIAVAGGFLFALKDKIRRKLNKQEKAEQTDLEQDKK